MARWHKIIGSDISITDATEIDLLIKISEPVEPRSERIVTKSMIPTPIPAAIENAEFIKFMAIQIPRHEVNNYLAEYVTRVWRGELRRVCAADVSHDIVIVPTVDDIDIVQNSWLAYWYELVKYMFLKTSPQYHFELVQQELIKALAEELEDDEHGS